MNNLALVEGYLDRVADPDQVSRRAAELRDAAAKAQTAINQAEAATKKARDDQIAAAAAILDLQQRHQQRMAAERREHEASIAGREAAAAAKEQRAADLERQALATLDEANKLKAQLKARLERVRKAASEAA